MRTEGVTGAAASGGESRPPYPRYALVLGAGVASFALYFWRAGRSFEFDEANTVGTFVRPGELLRPFHTQAVFNNHPLFSFFEVIVSRVTSTGEPALRLLPALLGAATVALFAWWARGRYGTAAAVAGAAVLATTPLFVSDVRLVRGYALVAFCALVASILLVDGRSSRLARLGYVLAIAVAVGTHLYALLVVLADFGYVVARRPIDRRRLVDLLIGSALGGMVYVGLWRGMIDSSRERGHQYRDSFVRDVADGLLGGNRVASALLVILLAIAAWTLLRRAEIVAALVLPLLAVMFVWQVARPTDLYPRFLIAAALPVAAAVAWGVHRHPRLLPVALVVAVVALAGQRDALQVERPIREAAELVAGTRALGLRPCAMGYLAIGAYTEVPVRFTNLGQVPQCDVVLQVNTFGDDMMRSLRAHYAYHWTFRGRQAVSTVPRDDVERAFRGFDD